MTLEQQMNNGDAYELPDAVADRLSLINDGILFARSFKIASLSLSAATYEMYLLDSMRHYHENPTALGAAIGFVAVGLVFHRAKVGLDGYRAHILYKYAHEGQGR